VELRGRASEVGRLSGLRLLDSSAAEAGWV